jgi:hypothetical protein
VGDALKLDASLKLRRHDDGSVERDVEPRELEGCMLWM